MRLTKKIFAYVLSSALVVTSMAGYQAQSAKADDNLITDANYSTHYGNDWTWCNGTVTAENGTFSFNMTRRGGGWADAIWGTQGVLENPPTEVGVKYTYSASVTANQDMTIRVKFTDGNNVGADITEVNLTANQTYEFSRDFTGITANSGKIVWALGGSNDTEAEMSYSATITNNVLTVSTNQDSTENPSENPSGQQGGESDNLFDLSTTSTHYGNDWTWCNGTVTAENGTFSFNMTRRGGGWADAIWGTQGVIENIPTEVGATYAYSATITSNQDMTVRVKFTDSNNVGTDITEVNLIANQPYEFSREFTGITANAGKIVWALGGIDDTEAEMAYSATITDNVIVAVGGGETESTSEAEQTSEVESTSAASGETDWADSGIEWVEHGDWKVYVGSWSSTQINYKLFDEANAIGVQRRYDGEGDVPGAGWDQWAAQLQLEILEGIDPSESYTFTGTLSSDNSDGKIYFGGTPYEFGNNPQTISLTQDAQVIEGTDVTFIQFTMALGHVGMGNGVYLKDVKVVDSKGKVVYPASTEPETTSQTVTTTERQTQKTTTAANPVKKQQVKVSKASKKKASKKLKVTLAKKIKGANGYSIRVFKTKSAAKKNQKSKALVNYTTKKNTKTFTVKNKKFKKAKTLYVRVRAYAKVNGKKVYSDKWSKVKKVKIK